MPTQRAKLGTGLLCKLATRSAPKSGCAPCRAWLARYLAAQQVGSLSRQLQICIAFIRQEDSIVQRWCLHFHMDSEVTWGTVCGAVQHCQAERIS